MKKKLTVAIVLILLLAVSLTTFVGCDEMFTRNEERDATQVVATVNYHGLSADIYKFELELSYNNYSYVYVNYYGMTEQETANYILRSLAQQKLLTLYAREKVAGFAEVPIPDDVKELLTRSEVNKAIENTNDSLLEQLKTKVEDSINEDKYNNSENDNDDNDDDDDEEVEITDAVTVRFNSNGGSDVEKQRIQKDTKAKKPTDPTKEGYVFYGWYEDESCNDAEFVAGTFEQKKDKDGNVVKDENKNPIYEYVSKEFDFKTKKVEKSMTLHARWVETTEARTEMPVVEEEEEDDYDPDDDSPTIEPLPTFFSDAYKATILEKFAEEDFAENISDKVNTTLEDYVDDGIAELLSDIQDTIFKKTAEDCYNYYLANQLDSILVTKMQRLIGSKVSVSEEEIRNEFNAIVNKNKQTFMGSNGESAYESALTSTLNETYYHPSLTNVDEGGSYGFVVNILLKLDDDNLATLTEMCKNDPSSVGAAKAKIVRNRLISEMKVKVSNPNYKSDAVVEDKDGEEIELRDPMTDPRNPYNSVSVGEGKAKNTEFEAEGGNDYTKLLTFRYNSETEEFEIVYGATEHAAMPYLEESVYAFSKDGKGVIEQIYDSLNAVMKYVDAEDGPSLSKEQGVYWLREVATKWLYLVGDDSGAVTDSSNNGGLGYLITPEGKDSNYLTDFTNYARELIKNGTGSYVAGAVNDNTFLGVTSPDGTMAGNGTAYVVADSFIGNGTTDFSSAYAGVFVLLNSYTVYNPSEWEYSEGDSQDGTMPINYNMTIGKDLDDIKSIHDTIRDSILEAKKTTKYNLDVNTMGVEFMESAITYYEKAYKSLWK
ncbi:MAG: InlB B-repeat-containing protein [Bacteroides sp.]|nr:InlB B-repeat-containing protein [Bacillota bacterium]MCM1394360.1 InlB B-repeat-containing protein [[Eubacterium] siraeum]MCM1456056.1 InlB B-repeat-containing protein [Bacteroides sp.]